MSFPSRKSYPYDLDQKTILREISRDCIRWPVEELPRELPRPPIPSTPDEELDTEFKREFPPDSFGSEADDASRVWKVYRAQATLHDNALLEGWNGTLDILLIFAGLFSAVITAFLVESYPSLQFDREGFAVSALYALVVSQNTTGGIPPLPIPPPVTNFPSTTSHWINGLWFTSLVVALSASLLCILVKQWLRVYKDRITASAVSPREWAHRRQLLYNALVAWKVSDLIAILPLLLHAALFLFLLGLVLFLWDLDAGIAGVAAFLTALLVVFYALSISIPIWKPECPTSTPLVRLIRVYIAIDLPALRLCLSSLPRYLQNAARHGLRRLRYRILGEVCSSDVEPGLNPPVSAYLPSAGNADLTDAAFRAVREEPSNAITRHPRGVETFRRRSTDQDIIRDHIQESADTLDGTALLWLIADVPDNDAVAVALQAIGGLQPSSRAAAFLRTNDAVRSRMKPEVLLTRSSGTPNRVEVARVAKTCSIVGMPDRRADSTLSTWRLMHPLGLANKGHESYPDFQLLETALYDHMIGPRVLPSMQDSPTATSTAMALIHQYQADALFLLQYCDFSSFRMDWDTVLGTAVRDVPFQIWKDVPDSSPPHIVGAARGCVALVALLNQFASSFNCHPDHEIILGTIMRLLEFLFPGATLTISPPSELGPAAVFGSCILSIVDFFDLPMFPVADTRALRHAVFVLQSGTEEYLKQENFSLACRVVRVTMSVLLRHTSLRRESRRDREIGGLRYTMSLGMTTSDQVAFMSHFLIPTPRTASSSPYMDCKDLWRGDLLLEGLHDIGIWLEEVHESLPSADIDRLVDAFFTWMPFVEVLQRVAGYTPRDECFQVLWRRLLDLCKIYQRLRWSTWLDTIEFATLDVSHGVRLLAGQLRFAVDGDEDSTVRRGIITASRVTRHGQYGNRDRFVTVTLPTR